MGSRFAMALRIGKLAGNGPGLWLRMQQAYDLWHVEQRLKEELARIKPAASGSPSAAPGTHPVRVGGLEG